MSDWSEPSFVASAHEWATRSAHDVGLVVDGAIEQIHLRPWSTVFRVPAGGATLYLKCCGPTQRHEPRLSAFLHRTAPGSLPEVLAVHDREAWMLVADGGDKLRDVRSGETLLDAWRELLPRYAQLERRLGSNVDAMLAFGTPDHRMPALVSGLARAVADEPEISGHREDRLRADERDRLRRVAATLERVARPLAELGIGDTIQHDDLHDGNVLVKDGRTVVFDWGDACISHPFFTLTVTLRVTADGIGAAEDGPEIATVRDAYLTAWRDVAPRDDLVAAAELARRVGQVSRALTWHAVAVAYPGADDVTAGFVATLRLVLELLEPLGRT